MLPELYSVIISCVGLIEMEVYSKILLQTCIVDIIGIVLFVIVQPVFVSDNGIGTVWEYGITHYLPNPWQFLSFIFYAFMIRFTSVNVCSQFIFRYLAVVRSVNIRRKHYLSMIISVLLPIILLFTLTFLSNKPTPENEHLTNYELAQILEIDNYTMENYVVGMRAVKFLIHIFDSRSEYFYKVEQLMDRSS
uniref:Uncharacterized protein n=1 Tax=Meloidogyne enterolobii TaxID=390850 RepID=A0A6V7W7L1_MELEN|nr:unnamed protein product [Meloidogyne enterolobii]